MSREILGQAIALAKAGRAGEGIEVLRPLVRGARYKSHALIVMGSCHELQGKVAEARYLYQEAIRSNPNRAAEWRKHAERCAEAIRHQAALGSAAGEDFEEPGDQDCNACGLRYPRRRPACPFCGEAAPKPPASAEPDFINFEPEAGVPAEESERATTGPLQVARAKAGPLAQPAAPGFLAARRSAQLLRAVRESEKRERELERQFEEGCRGLGARAEQTGVGAELPAAHAAMVAKGEVLLAEAAFREAESRLQEAQARLQQGEQERAGAIATLEREFRASSDEQKLAMTELKGLLSQLSSAATSIRRLEAELAQIIPGEAAAELAEMINQRIAHFERSHYEAEVRIDEARARESEARRLVEAKAAEVQTARSGLTEGRGGSEAPLLAARSGRAQASAALGQARTLRQARLGQFGRELLALDAMPAALAEEAERLERLQGEIVSLAAEAVQGRGEIEQMKSGLKRFLTRLCIGGAILLALVGGLAFYLNGVPDGLKEKPRIHRGGRGKGSARVAENGELKMKNGLKARDGLAVFIEADQSGGVPAVR